MNALDFTAFIVFVLDWNEGLDEPMDKERLDYLLQKWDSFQSFRFAEHDGNCIGHPYTCLRCYMDRIYREASLIEESLK